MTEQTTKLDTLATLDIDEIFHMIVAAWHARVPVLVLGEPGIGKTEIFRQAVLHESIQGALFERRMLRYQPTDVNGLPFPNKERTKTTWLAADFFPDESAGPGILFADEITALMPAMQAAVYSIFEDTRGTETITLPDNVVPMAAGNQVGQGAVAHKMSTALLSRFAQVYVAKVNPLKWCNWALDNGVNTELVYHIKARPEMLHRFDPKRAELPFACPRSIVNLSRFLAHAPAGTETTAAAAACGEEYAHDLAAFLKLYRNLPPIESILMNPETADLPNSADISYCIASALARHATPQNFGSVITYLQRFDDREFQIFALKDATRRDNSLTHVDAFKSWAVSTDATELLY